MTKKMLLKWLEGQKTIALRSLADQREAALKAYNIALYERVGLLEISDKVQALFNEIDNLVMDWHQKHESYLCTNGQYYGSVHNKVYCFISSTDATYELMKSQEFSREAPEQQEIKKHFDAMFNEVAKTYDSVSLNVQRLKDAKLGLEYLKELGFDLTDLLAQDTAPVETALAVPIDTRFLILAKEETQNEN